MTDEKLEINTLIRKYKGGNTFLQSLKKRLGSKYVDKVEFNGKSVPMLTDNQYESAKIALRL